MAETSWTLTWNEKAGQFFARFRRFDGSGWGTKRVPKSIARHQRLDAERFLIGWYAEYMRTGGLNVGTSHVVPAEKTLRLLGPRWLQYRYDDRGTKPNTYKGFKESLNNWILNNLRFDHAPIEHLNMEQDFTAETCQSWMNSLRGEESSRLVHVLDLKTIFTDCIGMGWLDQNMLNPFDRPAVKKAVSKLVSDARQERVMTHLSLAQIDALLTVPTRKIPDFRRLRYLLTLATGLRDHEVQGLTWKDLHLDCEIPYLSVVRQLDKIGSKPMLRYEDLVRQGLDKDAMWRVPNALVSDPKKQSFRDLPLLPLVVEALRRWRTGWKLYVGRAPENDDPVFPSGKGNRHSPPGQFCFVEAAELLRADLRRVQQSDKFNGIDLDFHGLRRTFATQLSSRGVSEGEIGDLLGHGAKSVARGHYIDKLLKRRLALLSLLPLPDRLQLQATVIQVERAGAEIIPMRKASGDDRA